jgi:hypothetical protein
MACAAQTYADDPCLPNSAGVTGEIDAKTAASIKPRSPADWDQCKEAGSIAGGVADLRDHHIGKEAVAILLMQSYPSLHGLSLEEIDRAYVSPVYESKEPWHDICVEYMNACYSK